MADDLVIIGASFLGGATLAGLATFFVSKNTTKKLVEEQRQLIANQQTEVKRKYEEELRQVQFLRQKETAELTESITAVQNSHSAQEITIKLLERCELEFADADTSGELWTRLFDIVKRLFEAELHMLFVLTPFAPFDILAPDTKPTASETKTLDCLRQATMELALQSDTAIQSFAGQDIAGFKEARAEPPERVEGMVREKIPEIDTIVVASAAFRSQRLGNLVLGFKGSPSEANMANLSRVLEGFAHAQYRMHLFEDEVRSSRRDFLTKLPNLKALDELLPNLLKACSETKNVSILLVECDNLKILNEKYGHLVGDELIKEMATMIQTSGRIEELNIRPIDHLVRYCGTQFIFVLEDTDLALAMTVAERIRAAVDMKTDWYGGVPRWSCSIGVCTAPEDEREYQIFLIKAEVALMFVKEKLSGNQAIAFSQVPRQYRTSKLSERIDGNLNVFDPFNLLSSMCEADRTGILTVENRQGRRFWVFIKDKIIEKSHLGNLRGDWAVTEFLSTFDDGEFTFQEYTSLDRETMEEIHRMHEVYSVRQTVARHLVDGQAAQEKLAAARRLITNTRLFVRPTREAANIIANLPQLSPAPSRAELEAMAAISKYVNGRTMLSAILDRLEQYPTYLRWHGSAFLIQHGAIELSKLALTFSL